MKRERERERKTVGGRWLSRLVTSTSYFMSVCWIFVVYCSCWFCFEWNASSSDYIINQYLPIWNTVVISFSNHLRSYQIFDCFEFLIAWFWFVSRLLPIQHHIERIRTNVLINTTISKTLFTFSESRTIELFELVRLKRPIVHDIHWKKFVDVATKHLAVRQTIAQSARPGQFDRI